MAFVHTFLQNEYTSCNLTSHLFNKSQEELSVALRQDGKVFDENKEKSPIKAGKYFLLEYPQKLHQLKPHEVYCSTNCTKQNQTLTDSFEHLFADVIKSSIFLPY